MAHRDTTYLHRKLVRVDLVQRDNSDALLQQTVLQEVLADALVVDHDVVQPPARRDLERSRLIVILRCK